MIAINVWTVLIAAIMTALFTGLGAFPLLFTKNFNRQWMAIFNGIAAGLMLGATFQLIHEGMLLGPSRTVLGLFLGLVLIVWANFGIYRLKERGADARKMILIVGVMTAHSFAEGIGVGVSFGGGEKLGFLVSTAIAIHNIPEGLAISLVLVPRGVSVLKAGFWSIFSSLPQPLMAVPAYLFILYFAPLLPVGLGLAAGAMIWMIFAELIEGVSSIAATLSFIVMLFFQVLLH